MFSTRFGGVKRREQPHMHASEVTREVVERANELYWGSDESVNQIADDLELSKGALYGIIEPEPSGLGCPLCGAEVVYANRTAKERGMLACPTCEWDGAHEEAMPGPVDEDPSPAGVEDRASDVAAVDDETPEGGEGTRSPARPPSRALAHADGRTIAGGALLGAAVGLALVLWARRR